MNNNQCAICLETNKYEVYKYCKDCSIYTHQICFFNYINYKNILPECIICKKQCQLNTNQTPLEKIKYMVYTFCTMCKKNPINFLKCIISIGLWYNYLNLFVYDSFKKLVYYGINEIYDTSGYYVMIGMLYGISSYYTNIISTLLIVNMFKWFLHYKFNHKILHISIIQSYYNYSLYKYILPDLFISVIITIPTIISIFRIYNLYKLWNLILICNQYN